MTELKKYSKTISLNDTQPASQAMLYGVGLSESEMQMPFVGIASTGYEGNTCNMHLNDLASKVKMHLNEKNCVGLIFNTIGISDGITNGTDGMRYSLVSREIIADSMEAFIAAHYYDAWVAIAGCDKNMPGAVMAMLRLNRPSLLLYGGTIHSGSYKNQSLNIVSAFEAYGKKLCGQISNEDYKGVIRNACPGAGACGGMYTANTMSACIEALGLSLPYSSNAPAMSNEKKDELLTVAVAIRTLLEKDIRPSDIVSRKSFENAMRLLIVLGGSTNAVMHLLAMAHTANIPLTLNDFQRMSDETSVLANLKPSGEYLMEDLHRIGGVPSLMKYLLNKGMLHGDCLTVTGLTIEENLKHVNEIDTSHRIILPFENPIKQSGHLKILRGNLAPEGSVAKISGKEGKYFKGYARVFNHESEFEGAMLRKDVMSGSVIVIRYSGPKGAPGMPEMLKPSSMIMGAGMGNDVALITDGRFSGGTHGFVVGHICPESYEGGPIALVKDGDEIIIDIDNGSIDLLVSDNELNERRRTWSLPVLPDCHGVLKKYRKHVGPASLGCLTV
jgi:dihydroxy-acid dehydratase